MQHIRIFGYIMDILLDYGHGLAFLVDLDGWLKSATTWRIGGGR